MHSSRLIRSEILSCAYPAQGSTLTGIFPPVYIDWGMDEVQANTRTEPHPNNSSLTLRKSGDMFWTEGENNGTVDAHVKYINDVVKIIYNNILVPTAHYTIISTEGDGSEECNGLLIQDLIEKKLTQLARPNVDLQIIGRVSKK
jgi:hypothetical protein